MIVLLAVMFMNFAGFVRADTAAARSFLFTYAGTISGLSPGSSVRIWIPVAKTTADQTVEIVSQDVAGHAVMHADQRRENAFLYCEATAPRDGDLSFSVVYRVTRREVLEQADDNGADASVYLRPDALVPVGGKPANVFLSSRSLPADSLQKARALYDLVDDHMQYRKDKPGWGRGDAVWACDSGFGNCTDFHSLFISLARSLNIPAKFEMGFAIPVQRGQGEIAGYHCWAKFKPIGHGWVPVDISQAHQEPAKREYYFGRLDENRVMFSTGRDLELVPRQTGPPVNFLVYPYVEAGGQPWPQEKIKRAFNYKDVDAPIKESR